MRQSVQTAGKLPAKLSASVPVGVIRLAMMGDQSCGKWWWVKRFNARKAGPVDTVIRIKPHEVLDRMVFPI